MASQPVGCNSDFDNITVHGRTAIVTGGAQSIGEAYVRALVNAGAHVVIGDIDVDRAEGLVAESPNQVQSSKCDVTNWDDQVSLFHAARVFSPTKLIHVVVANAGISSDEDGIFITGHENQEDPSESSLKMLDVNFKGVVYTAKLALHHFRRQHAAATAEGDPAPETSLILQGSIASYMDSSTFCEYATSKWAVRGLMRTLRRVVPAHGTMVNAICPSFLRTALVPRKLLELLDAKGIALATGEDAGQCLLRILSDGRINGRALCVVARNLVEQAPRGY
ncbi:Short-chain dehydrogenase/reductase SDR [Botryosphaeria dothidea]|uniref:Short-chain dehydrogenase/reductase SDR n=1 Tax=Botryosphaeria dothidea TaxID=55169 RepID=A0A8H4IR43_9PEZI|nr:Short-chain dehydrogenase/reductase SDR [Botryosphaeria dothidea]